MVWTLDDINLGQFVIPEGFNVFGNPHQCLPNLLQVCIVDLETWGLYNFTSGILSYKFPNAQSVVNHLNGHNMRLLTRKELSLLILYMEQDYFALPPEDQPLDNG